MRVPDDVTLLWCDDNWGNIRRLPTPEERKRSGGAGIYYHFDYVGDPRYYKWLNTIPITKVWEQMNLAYEYGADRIWIVNVGDLKPMEFPIEFFLTSGLEPASLAERSNRRIHADVGGTRIRPGVRSRNRRTSFRRYTKFNGRRKPELLDPDTFSLVNYQEADSVLAEWQSLSPPRRKRFTPACRQNERDAFYELVLYPDEGFGTGHRTLHHCRKKPSLCTARDAPAPTILRRRFAALFQADADLSAEYNHTLADGKWNHMMDQTHLGYTSWQQPPQNVMPEVREMQIRSWAAYGRRGRRICLAVAERPSR